MSSLGEISWINDKIDDSPLETIKLLFKLIYGELCRFNRKKLKSFTGFHLDYENIETKIAKVTEDFCICKLKIISNLLSLEQTDTGRDMAESVCFFLNDISKLQQQLFEYAEFKKARANTQLNEESNQQLCHRLKQSATNSLDNQKGNSTAANFNLKTGYHTANKFSQDSWGNIEFRYTQLTGIPQNSKQLVGSIIPAFTINIKLEDLGCTVEAILDTGSPISFLSYGVVPKSVQFESYDNHHQFRGITGNKINIIGLFKQMVVTQECEKLVNFYVIPNGVLSSSCLLGRDYISQTLLTLNGGISNITDKTG